MSAGVLTAQFSTEGDPISAAIRYFTDSDISHVDLVVPRYLLRGPVCDALTVKGYNYALLGARFNGGVQARSPHYAKFTKIVQLKVAMPNVEAAYAFALAQIGKPYNKGAILDFVLHRRRKYSPRQARWFCDELLYAVCTAGGTLLLDTDNPLDLTPKEVMLSPKWEPVR